MFVVGVVRKSSLRRAHHSSRGVTPCVVCDREASIMSRPWPTGGCRTMGGGGGGEYTPVFWNLATQPICMLPHKDTVSHTSHFFILGWQNKEKSQSEVRGIFWYHSIYEPKLN